MMNVDKLPVPFKNKVLVEVTELGERTAGGLYIPESAQTKHKGVRGTVRATGPECKLGLKEGDVVFFEPYSGSRMYFKVGDGTPKDHLIVVEDAILGILVKDNG